jgi:hypothetical protein
MRLVTKVHETELGQWLGVSSPFIIVPCPLKVEGVDRDENNAVGLLWDGLTQGGRRAMMSDITLVEQRLGVTLTWAFT